MYIYIYIIAYYSIARKWSKTTTINSYLAIYFIGTRYYNYYSLDDIVRLRFRHDYVYTVRYGTLYLYYTITLHRTWSRFECRIKEWLDFGSIFSLDNNETGFGSNKGIRAIGRHSVRLAFKHIYGGKKKNWVLTGISMSINVWGCFMSKVQKKVLDLLPVSEVSMSVAGSMVDETK